MTVSFNGTLAKVTLEPAAEARRIKRLAERQAIQCPHDPTFYVDLCGDESRMILDELRTDWRLLWHSIGPSGGERYVFRWPLRDPMPADANSVRQYKLHDEWVPLQALVLVTCK